jgi:hypothetical protein
MLPLIITLTVIWKKPTSKINLFINATLGISVFSFLYLWGQWPLVGSYCLRYILVVLLFVVLLFSIKKFSPSLPTFPDNLLKSFLTGIAGLLTIFCLKLTIDAFKGRYYPVEGVELNFPLKNGTFYIASGGSNKLINNHLRNVPGDQQFALDINRLGKWGGVSKGILSGRNENHHIFKDTIYCPCHGKIVDIMNTIEDNSNSNMHVSAENGRGNFISVDCGGWVVSMFHLKKNSIMVIKGAEVNEDQPLGLVGNSGFSQEPHLHIQASRINQDSIMIGVPIQIKGEFLSRNDILTQ